MPRSYIRIEGAIPPGAEGTSLRGRFAPEADDVQGNMPWSRIKPEGTEAENAEGNMPRFYLAPTEDEEAAGNMPRYYLAPVEDEGTEGNVLKSHVLQIERDDDGELIGRFVPAEDDDDTGGHGRGRS